MIKKNQRKSLRVPINLKVIIHFDDELKVNLLKNVSKTGVFIQTLEPLNEGNIVNLLFSLGDFDKTIKLKAKVVRKVPPNLKSQDYTLEGMGLEFTNITFEDESIIEDYLHFIKPIYEEINILIDNPRKNIERIDYLLSKLNLDKYNDFFELKENIKYACLSLGLIKG